MVTTEEIKKLADLARIEIGEEEIENLRGEMDSILEYVGQVSEITESEDLSREARAKWEGEVNVMREDANPTDSQTHSKELIAEFPQKEGDYLKVKKILG